jgi:ABC-type transport system substrate-binding protein
VLLAGATDRPGALPAARHFAAALRRIGLRPRIVARPVGAAPSARGYFGFVGAPGTRVQAGWTHWLVSAPDAAGFFAGPFTCAGRRAPPASGNLAGYCDSTTDAMIARAQRLARTDRAAAADAWARVDARVTRAAVWVPFAGHRLLDVVSRRAQGYAYNPTYSILLDQLSVR